MELEEYQGYTIESEPGRSGDLLDRKGIYWFNVYQGGAEVFRLQMEVTRLFAYQAQGGKDLTSLAERYGRDWVRGLIDLGRFESGHELRTSQWNPVFGEGTITDDDLRLELLGALRRKNLAQQNASMILSLDVGGVAAVLGLTKDRVKGALSELLLEGLAQPYAETFGHTAANGACQITGAGLKEFRSLEARTAKQARPLPTPAERGQIEFFIAYSHKDQTLRDELEKHLGLLKRQGVIACWHDRKITAGKQWKTEIDVHLDASRVILLLISADFLASDYCYDVEVKRAMERHRAGQARVIPVILRACDWKPAPFGELQALPKDAQAVTSWTNADEAFANIAFGIRAAVEEMTSNP